MRVIVSDSSCLIDLKKGGLLRAIFELPFTIAIPQPLFEEELTSITPEEKQMMIDAGLEIIVLPGEQVVRAGEYMNANRRLHVNDCFALVLAEETEESILLTGDNPLRAVAQNVDIEVHGVLWAIDRLHEHTNTPAWMLHEALTAFNDDPLVWLPEDELLSRLRKLRKLL